MKLLPLFILIVLALAGLRIYLSARRRRAESRETWDAKLVRQLREKGLDPFQPHELDFLFDLPSDAAQSVRQKLEAESFTIDTHPIADDGAQRISLHARKSMRLSVDEISALSNRFTALAQGLGGRYDGWVVHRHTTPGG